MARMSILTTFIHYFTELPSQCNNKGKEIKGLQIRLEANISVCKNQFFLSGRVKIDIAFILFLIL